MPYKIVADNMPDFPQGSTVTDEQLEGLNIEALIEGGFIQKTTSKKAED
jgi:hypothetical protein